MGKEGESLLKGKRDRAEKRERESRERGRESKERGREREQKRKENGWERVR